MQSSTVSSDIDRSRALWIREIQEMLPSNPRFSSWQHQFGLYLDDSQIWRCKGRLFNSSLPSHTKYPILLDKSHYLTFLIVQDAHRRVLHNGVRETLTEIRSQFWIVRGRQFVRKILHQCVVCQRIEGGPFKGKPSPPYQNFVFPKQDHSNSLESISLDHYTSSLLISSVSIRSGCACSFVAPFEQYTWSWYPI